MSEQALLVKPGTWESEAIDLDLPRGAGWLGEPSFSADGRCLLIPSGDDRLYLLED